MLLKQVFKTLDGAQKRATFENAHSKTHRWIPTRCVDDKPDTSEFNRAKIDQYTWRLNKVTCLSG